MSDENSAPLSAPEAGPPAPSFVSLQLPSVAPRVTFAILGITVLVYLIQILTPNHVLVVANNQYLVDLPTSLGAKVNELIRNGELWRLIAPILLHAGIAHIGFNMYALFVFGQGLERRYGYARFLALYLLAGFSGNVLSFLFSSGFSVGASTSIFGLVGAEGVFIYQNRSLFADKGRAALNNIIAIAAINLFIGLSSGGLIDNWGHIGVFIGGALFGWMAGPRLEVQGIYPLVQIVDHSEPLHAWNGAALVLILFGALALVGIYFPIVP